MTTLEIVDENGNIHGPFETHEEMMKCVDDLALGDERGQDDEIGRGWYMRAVTASIGKLLPDRQTRTD